MRRLGQVPILLVLAAMTDAAFACQILPPSQRDAWARSNAAEAAVVMDATVSRAQNTATGEAARLAPLRRYKGPAQSFYDMAPRRAGGEIITHTYNGLFEPGGSRGFFVLFAHSDGYRTDPCVEMHLSDAATRRAFLRHGRRVAER